MVTVVALREWFVKYGWIPAPDTLKAHPWAAGITNLYPDSDEKDMI